MDAVIGFIASVYNGPAASYRSITGTIAQTKAIDDGARPVLRGRVRAAGVRVFNPIQLALIAAFGGVTPNRSSVLWGPRHIF